MIAELFLFWDDCIDGFYQKSVHLQLSIETLSETLISVIVVP